MPVRRRKRQRWAPPPAQPTGWRLSTPTIYVWALEDQFDQTSDGRILKLLNVVDEHTRQALAITVDRRIDADATGKVLDVWSPSARPRRGSSAATTAQS